MNGLVEIAFTPDLIVPDINLFQSIEYQAYDEGDYRRRILTG